MYRVLIIGSGGIGKRHLRGYLRTGRAAISIVEPDAQKRDAVQKEYAIDEAFADLKEVDLPRFDLAVICAPAHVHLSIMRLCAKAKLPFLVEKPLAVTMEEVDDTLALVQKSGVLARVGYVRRIAPEILALKARIDAGEIGAVKLIYAFMGQEFPKYRPDFQSTYYAVPEMGGGAILDASSHTLDLLIWLLGKPVAVSGMYDRLHLEGTRTEDTCLIHIRFESGAMAALALNQFQKPNLNEMQVIGTEGSLILRHSVLDLHSDDSAAPATSTDHMSGLVPTQAHEARFGLQAEAMLDALEGKPCALATLEEARLSLVVAVAAKTSWDSKTIVEL